MRARATVVAEADGRFPTLVGEPPLTLRATADGVRMVGSAAGPVGGDDLGIDIVVRSGAGLRIGTVAAQFVYPGPHGRPSRTTITAAVAAHGQLAWMPEPTVAVAGADHVARACIDLAGGATLRWREVVVLGRHGEPSGSVHQRTRVVRDGVPLFDQSVHLGPGGPATTGARRVCGSLVVVGGPPPEGPGVFALASDAWLVTVLGDDVEPVLSSLDAHAHPVVAGGPVRER